MRHCWRAYFCQFLIFIALEAAKFNGYWYVGKQTSAAKAMDAMTGCGVRKSQGNHKTKAERMLRTSQCSFGSSVSMVLL